MTRIEELHDLYCPDVGLGCNMNTPRNVHHCPFFSVIKSVIEAERRHLSALIQDEQRFLTVGDKELLLKMIQGESA